MRDLFAFPSRLLGTSTLYDYRTDLAPGGPVLDLFDVYIGEFEGDRGLIECKMSTAAAPTRPPSPVVTDSNTRPACSPCHGTDKPFDRDRLHKSRPVRTLRPTLNQRPMTEPKGRFRRPSLLQKVESLPQQKSPSCPHPLKSKSEQDQTAWSVSIPRKSKERSRSPVRRPCRYPTRLLQTLTGVLGGTRGPLDKCTYDVV